MLALMLANVLYLVSAALLVLGVIMMVAGTVFRRVSRPEPGPLEEVLQQRLDQIREAEQRSIAASHRRRETVTAGRQRYGSIG